MLRVGDYVVRISYNGDVLFKVLEIDDRGIAKLKGMYFRVIADAPIEDLRLAGGMRFTTKEHYLMEKIEQTIKQLQYKKDQGKDPKNPSLLKVGKVLHIDGDVFYLDLCMKYYEQLGIPAVGEPVPESLQPRKIASLIDKYNPDILVLTGHDSLNKKAGSLEDINAYKHSGYFVEAVKEARHTTKGSGHLVIFAGACQSYFEALLEAGADFAASPNRVLIHALDPVFIVERIAYCPLNHVLTVEEAIKYTITKTKGLGGYEVLGVARRGGPVVDKRERERARKKEEASQCIEQHMREIMPKKR